MSEMRTYDYQELLADLHLGALGADERSALEARLRDDPELAREHQRLSQACSALETVRAEPVPPGLHQRIAARVRAAGPPPTLRVADGLESGQVYSLKLQSFRDIAAVAAMIVLAVGVGVPGLLHLRERNQRMICADNMAQIGRGMQAYALAANGSLPFAGWDGGRYSWRPTTDPGVVVQPNRQHLYLLVKVGLVSPEAFVCPSSDGVPMSGRADQFSDFPQSANLSYAYQNMAGVRPSPQRDQPNMPILSDDNPLFDGGLPRLDRLTVDGRHDLNSRAHGGAGQNLLTLDGRSIWTTTPYSGVNGDNVWLLDRRTEYTGREGPQTSTDAHLIK
jgi:hypothetical protein